MGKVVLSEQQECKFLVVGKIIMDKDDVAALSAFTPPSKDDPLWRFDFRNGDMGVSDGNTLLIYGKKEVVEGKKDNVIVMPGYGQA